jgi:hypothetical protein
MKGEAAAMTAGRAEEKSELTASLHCYFEQTLTLSSRDVHGLEEEPSEFLDDPRHDTDVEHLGEGRKKRAQSALPLPHPSSNTTHHLNES